MGNKGRLHKRILGWRRQNRVSHRGGIEHLLPGRILGWTIAENTVFHEVRLLIGTHLIARAEVNQPRPDVCEQLSYQGFPGFSLSLPEHISSVDWSNPPRLIALSVDAGIQYDLKIINHPEETASRLQSLLQSNILGLVGHFDGIVDGALQGWAARSRQQQPTQVWLQSEKHDPIPLSCDQRREGMADQDMPENCGFRIPLSQLPARWAGISVWCSFDREGNFLLPQNQPVRMPVSSAKRTAIAEKQATVLSYPLTSTSSSEHFDLHWQTLEEFRLFLDDLERELDRQESLPPIPVPKRPAKPSGWIRRLMGRHP